MFKNKKILISIIILFFVISLNTISNAKYVIEYTNTVAKISIDRTAPNVEVNYSINEPTSGNVIVIINTSEPIQAVKDWTLSKDKMQLSKEYEQNCLENVDIYDIAGNLSTTTIEVNNIDKKSPFVELIEINNSNANYEKFANLSHVISFKIKIFEPNIIVNNFNKENIKLLVNNKSPYSPIINVEEINKEFDGLTYNVVVSNLDGNGELSLIIKDGIIMDIGNRTNAEKIIDTGIMIDNVAPIANFEEKAQEDGTSKIIINTNEKIRELSGWTISDDNLNISKIFKCNTVQKIGVSDCAHNNTEIEITVNNAKSINILYASHNSGVGWSDIIQSGEIAGKEAVKMNPNFKVESLAFNIEGNTDSDFVQARAYVYSRWKDSCGICKTSSIKYNYGYNPSQITYKSMNSKDLISLNGKKYFQFGGAGINELYNTDENGENPITQEESITYPYGISAISFKLKDYSYYSIVYQIYVNDYGWLEPKSDGEETVASYQKPMSLFRVKIIPKAEKAQLINTWKGK